MVIGIAIGVGLVAGVASGMLGIGGGTVIIPALVLALNIEQHVAQGVALCAMLAAAVAGTIQHRRQGDVRLGVFALVVPGAVVFSFVGAWVAGLVTADWLSRVFAVALIIIGTRMLLFNRGGRSVSTC